MPRLLILLLSLLLSSCFGRFVMTEKELHEYYKDKPKPNYFTLKNDSISLFCAAAGSDTLPPLLIIHGAPGAWYGSRSFLNDSNLTNNFQVIAVDRPGFGKSKFKNKLKSVTSIEVQAIACREALQVNKSNKTAIVMGSSYGAPIAANMAILYPNEFHHVVMLAGSIDPDNEKFWWWSPFIKHGPIKWMLPKFLRITTDEKNAHVKELRKLQPKWNDLNVPITVIQGGADEIVKPVNFEFAKATLKNKSANFIFLPEAGHLIRFQYPDLVKSILIESLKNNKLVQGKMERPSTSSN